MRELCKAGWLLLLLPVWTHAQSGIPDQDAYPPVESQMSQSGFESLRGLPEARTASQGPFSALPPNPRRHCCNIKGALIGAGIGAGLATVLTRNLCDAGDCTGDYIKGALILGGIGAGLGALIHTGHTRSMPSRRDTTMDVSPVISGPVQGVMVTARF
jgi:hypothetical protein